MTQASGSLRAVHRYRTERRRKVDGRLIEYCHMGRGRYDKLSR